MVYQRKPFFIRNNFQLKLIIGFVAILGVSILGAALLLVFYLKDIIEQAVFSSHLSLISSGDLFWRTILSVNLLMGLFILFAGLLLIIGVHVYLQNFFHSLVQGFEKLKEGNFSFRLNVRGMGWGKSILKDFNDTADHFEKRTEHMRAHTDAALSALESPSPSMWEKLKSIHKTFY